MTKWENWTERLHTYGVLRGYEKENLENWRRHGPYADRYVLTRWRKIWLKS